MLAPQQVAKVREVDVEHQAERLERAPQGRGDQTVASHVRRAQHGVCAVHGHDLQRGHEDCDERSRTHVQGQIRRQQQKDHGQHPHERETGERAAVILAALSTRPVAIRVASARALSRLSVVAGAVRVARAEAVDDTRARRTLVAEVPRGTLLAVLACPAKVAGTRTVAGRRLAAAAEARSTAVTGMASRLLGARAREARRPKVVRVALVAARQRVGEVLDAVAAIRVGWILILGRARARPCPARGVAAVARAVAKARRAAWRRLHARARRARRPEVPGRAGLAVRARLANRTFEWYRNNLRRVEDAG
mmetsp:Transcript_4168/g.15387  ORF Transcript_4168/g.15387 Transcript_4168/m.15387 type:complete len:308 (-) Transcript_4168:1268-2191(-)